MNIKVSRVVLLLPMMLLLSSCYSFTGSSIPAHIHTIGIPIAEDVSGFGQSNVRQDLTDLLIQKFTTEGSLRIAPRSSADALLELSITHIPDEPVSVKAGEAVTTKRVTIQVDATYRDQKKQKVFWQRSFSQSQDYPLAQNIEGVRTALKQAEQKLGEDILIAVISNW